MVLASCSKIDGRSAFKLYDTYGFPIEITCEMAAEKGVDVDVAGFEERFKKHQENSHARVRTSSTLEMSLGWGRNRGLHPQSRFAVSTQQSIHATFLTFASVSPLGSGIDPAV